MDKYGTESIDELINFEQFVYLMTDHVTENDSQQDMKRLFNLYEDDRCGYLDKDKLRKIAEEYGIWITNDEI